MDWACSADQFSCKYFFCSFKIERVRAHNMESVRDRDVFTWFAERLIDQWSLQLWARLLAEWSFNPRLLLLWLRLEAEWSFPHDIAFRQLSNTTPIIWPVRKNKQLLYIKLWDERWDIRLLTLELYLNELMRWDMRVKSLKLVWMSEIVASLLS